MKKFRRLLTAVLICGFLVPGTLPATSPGVTNLQLPMNPVNTNPYVVGLGLVMVGALSVGLITQETAQPWEDRQEPLIIPHNRGANDSGPSFWWDFSPKSGSEPPKESPSEPGKNIVKYVVPLTVLDLVRSESEQLEKKVVEGVTDRAIEGVKSGLDVLVAFKGIYDAIANPKTQPSPRATPNLNPRAPSPLKVEDVFPDKRMTERGRMWDLWLNGNYRDVEPVNLFKNFPMFFMYGGPSALDLTYNYNPIKRYGAGSEFQGFDPRMIRDGSVKKRIEDARAEIKKLTEDFSSNFKHSLASNPQTMNEVAELDLERNAQVYGPDFVEKARGWLRPTPLPETVSVETAYSLLDPLWQARDTNDLHTEIEKIGELYRKVQKWKLDPEMKDLARYLEKEIKRVFVDKNGWQQNLPSFVNPALFNDKALNVDVFRGLNHLLAFKTSYEMIYSLYIRTQGPKLSKDELEYSLALRRALHVVSNRWMDSWTNFAGGQGQLNLAEESDALAKLIEKEREILREPDEFIKNSEELFREIEKRQRENFREWSDLNVAPSAQPQPQVQPEPLPQRIVTVTETAVIDFFNGSGRGVTDADLATNPRTIPAPQTEVQSEEEKKKREEESCDSESAKRSFEQMIRSIVPPPQAARVVARYVPHLSFVRLWSAKRANRRYQEKFGYHHNPVRKYSCATEVQVVVGFSDGIFKRLSGAHNPVGPWFYDQRDFAGHTVADLEKKLGLFEPAALITDVAPSAGADLLISTAESYGGRGTGGGRQFSYWMTRPHPGDFGESRPLVEAR